MTHQKSNSSKPEEDLSPLITIGITCYNSSDTVYRCVESALKQQWKRKEIIIIDDCSNDNTWSILNELKDEHSKVRIIRNETNQGYPRALNLIIQEAKGDYVAIFDDDDYSVPERLTEQWRRLCDYEKDHQTNLVFCYSNRNVVKSGESNPDHIAFGIGRRHPEPNGITVAECILGYGNPTDYVWGMFGSCTLMARQTTFTKVGTFDESFRRCAEWDYAIRGAFLGCHFISVNKPLITQYKTPTADKAGTIPLKYSLKIRKKHRRYLTDHGVFWASCAMAYSRFHNGKGRVLRSYFYMGIACLTAPKIFIGKLGLHMK